jgi:hypothetical protein
MPMNPRTLCPQSSTPTFSEKGYTRLWGLSTKSTATISGSAETDTGMYAVKWQGKPVEFYQSGETFSETPIVDSSANALAVTNNGAAISTAQSKFGGASGYFNGSAYLTAPFSSAFEFGTGDFTVEGWIYWNEAEQGTLISAGAGWNGSGPWHAWALTARADENNVYWSRIDDRGDDHAFTISVPYTFSLNQWYHIAVSRTGTATKIFIDGIEIASSTDTNNYTAIGGGNNNDIHIGYWVTGLGDQYHNGYIDGVRIVKGTALYTGSSFPLPTSAPTAVTGTSLLLNFDAATKGKRAFEVYPATNGIQVPQSALSATPATELLLSFNGSLNDSSGNGRTATATGGATISTANSKWGGSSLYLSGTTTSVTVPLSSDFEFGTGDFTVEAWVYDARPGDRLRVAGIGMGANAGTPHDKTGWSVIIRGYGQLWLYQYDGTTETYYDSPEGSVPQDEWAHVVVTRAAGTLRMFVNGAQVAVHTGVTLSLNSINSDPLYVGTFREGGGLFDLGAYISDLRIIKGASADSVQAIPFGQFDAFTLSGNSLVSLRAEDVALEAGSGYYTQTVFPYSYLPNPTEAGNIANNALSSQALDAFYTDLMAGGGDLFVQGNPGIDADDPTIATAKGYTVFGSEPP